MNLATRRHVAQTVAGVSAHLSYCVAHYQDLLDIAEEDEDRELGGFITAQIITIVSAAQEMSERASEVSDTPACRACAKRTFGSLRSVLAPWITEAQTRRLDYLESTVDAWTNDEPCAMDALGGLG